MYFLIRESVPIKPIKWSQIDSETTQERINTTIFIEILSDSQATERIVLFFCFCLFVCLFVLFCFVFFFSIQILIFWTLRNSADGHISSLGHLSWSNALWREKGVSPPGRKKLGRWNERARAILLWCKGLGTTKTTKQDGGHNTGPSERLPSER